MGFIFWLVAVAVFIWGIKEMIKGNFVKGILLWVLAAAIGPGGWSIWASQDGVDESLSALWQLRK